MNKDLICYMGRYRVASEGANYFRFQRVSDGKYITLGVCFNKEIVLNNHQVVFFSSILDAEEYYDIIWDKSEDNILPMDINLGEVRLLYRDLVKEGIEKPEINNYIMNTYMYSRGR